MKKARIEADELAWRLRTLGSEVEAVGFFLKWHQSDAVFEEEVQTGVGEILERLGRRARSLSRQVEKLSQLPSPLQP